MDSYFVRTIRLSAVTVRQNEQWQKKKKNKMFNSASVLNIFEVLYYTHIKQFLKITDSNL